MSWFQSVNWWAIIVAAIVNMVLGGLWYSPLLMAKPWMALMSLKPEDMKSQGAKATRGYIISAVVSLIIAGSLAILTHRFHVNTVEGGFKLGLVVGIGLVAAPGAANYAFDTRSYRLYFINAGYSLIGTVIMSMIVAGWY